MAFTPPEIWMHVAKFIPKDELSAMFAINATFFNLAMDIRYQKVEITSFDDTSMKRMQRLRDPAIAHRVQILHFRKPQVSQIQPELINDAVHTSTATPHTNPDQPSINVPRSEMVDMRLAVQTLTDTVTCLTNVTTFSIQRADGTTEDDLLPFFTAALKTFGSRLESLTCHNYLSILLSATDDLKALEILNVAITQEHFPDRTVVATILAPFINKVAPTLQVLGLTFLGPNWRLSQLFSSLEHIPHLELFGVCALLSVYGFSAPLGGGLTHFLRSHATTLRQVSLVSYHKMDYLYPFGSHVTGWLEENQHDEIILSNLSTLNIPIPHHRLDLMMRYVRRSTETLTKLWVPGCDLDYDGVNTLVSTFSQRRNQLRYLYIQVQRLTAEYIPLLARSLPGLYQLELNVKVVGAAVEVIGHGLSPGELERRRVRDFVKTMRTYDFSRWELLHFAIIIVVKNGENPGLDATLRRVFAECVPSLVSISGMLKDDVLAEEIYADLLP